MAIVADDSTFPNNIVEMIALRSELIDDDLFVVKRPLKSTDPNQSIGVTASLWTPNEDSLEMKGMGQMEPSLSRYLIQVQAFVKDMDEIRGLNVHSVLSRRIRAMLYNDAPLRASLWALSSTMLGVTEQTQRWGVSRQRFISNEISSSWLYLSILEFWLETETI